MILGVFMSSQKLKKFIEEMKYKNRNPQNSDVLELLRDDKTNPVMLIEEGSLLYRGRLIRDDYNHVNVERGFNGYDEKNSYIPPTEKTRELRANYSFIPYLYATSTKELAKLEVRPNRFDFISIATIEVLETLRCFSLVELSKDKVKNDTKLNLLKALASLYCKPVSNDDEKIEYIPTQYIAEFIKNLGYDAIIYPSSHRATDDEYCIVVFSHNKCRAIGSDIEIIT